MKTGIEMISAERVEQIEKHGFNDAHDLGPGHSNGELVAAAVYLLAGVPRGSKLGAYPITWKRTYKKKFDEKNRIERLVIAGALIAAELDRLNAGLRCPRCNSHNGLQLPRDSSPYCGDCGWPDND